MNKLKIFLSGKMTGLTKQEATAWRKLFVLKQTSYDTLTCIDPTYYYFPQETTDQLYEKEAMKFDFYHLTHSDIIIVNLNHQDSIGTAQELAIAHYLNIPIIGIIEEDKYLSIHPWYKEECTKIFTYALDNFEDTIGLVLYYINSHYSI